MVVVTVPTTSLFSTATKQPRGSSQSKRRKSPSVWFHPASRRNSSEASRSASVILRKETLSIVAFRNDSTIQPDKLSTRQIRQISEKEKELSAESVSSPVPPYSLDKNLPNEL